MYTNCYYSKSKRTIVTFPNPSNAEIGLYGTTIAKLRDEYPDMELMLTSDAEKHRDDSFKTVPIEITEDQFNYAFESLPPENWKNIKGGFFFQMMEYIVGQITNYYVKLDGKFYKFADTAWMGSTEVLNKLTGEQS